MGDERSAEGEIVALTNDVAEAHRVRDLIEALIADPRQLGPDYAPVHSLPDGALVGYKATGRGASGTTQLADTLSLLDGARSLGLVERLDWAFRALAIEDMLRRPDLALHLTPEPETFGRACPPRLAGVMSRGHRELSIVAEVHADAFADTDRLGQGLAEIRDWGGRIALTDIADDEDAVRRADEAAPDIVQLDLRLAGRADSDEHHGVRRLHAVAKQHEATIMAVGVDSPSAREQAIALGATLARGDVFGVPGALPELSPAPGVTSGRG